MPRSHRQASVTTPARTTCRRTRHRPCALRLPTAPQARAPDPAARVVRLLHHHHPQVAQSSRHPRVPTPNPLRAAAVSVRCSADPHQPMMPPIPGPPRLPQITPTPIHPTTPASSAVAIVTKQSQLRSKSRSRRITRRFPQLCLISLSQHAPPAQWACSTLTLELATTHRQDALGQSDLCSNPTSPTLSSHRRVPGTSPSRPQQRHTSPGAVVSAVSRTRRTTLSPSSPSRAMSRFNPPWRRAMPAWTWNARTPGRIPAHLARLVAWASMAPTRPLASRQRLPMHTTAQTHQTPCSIVTPSAWLPTRLSPIRSPLQAPAPRAHRPSQACSAAATTIASAGKASLHPWPKSRSPTQTTGPLAPPRKRKLRVRRDPPSTAAARLAEPCPTQISQRWAPCPALRPARSSTPTARL